MYRYTRCDNAHLHGFSKFTAMGVCTDILIQLEPTEAELRQREALLHTVDSLVKREWPGVHAASFQHDRDDRL
jgi:DNA polymerase sigma